MDKTKGKSRKKRLWIIIPAALFLAVLLLLVILLDVGSWKPLDMQKLLSLQQSARVYDRNGQEIQNITGGSERYLVSIEEVPQHVKLAFLAAEDSRFYSHIGIDLWRIGGAIVNDIKTRSLSQGASTITQQLIKLSHLTDEKKFARKAQEAWLAMKLERKASKDEILEMYLNTLYFGNGAYGIEAASRAYFGKSVSGLTLEEGALLAAIIKSPTRYAPHIQPENALRRRNLVLEYMQEYEFAASAEVAAAKEKPIQLNDSRQGNMPQFGWYVDYATEEAAAILNISTDDLLLGGYEIHTALNPDVQARAEALAANPANYPADAKDGAKVQTAITALDTRTGEILCMVGGRSYDTRRGLNRAAQMRRQPGSALKPIAVYAPAIERSGFTTVTIMQDEPKAFGEYQPGNSGGVYRGTVTLREALARSLNVPAVEILSTIGVTAARESMARMGIEPDAQDANLSLALGSMTYGVSPVKLCAAYLPFANGGMYRPEYSVRRILDGKGNTLYTKEPQNTQVISAQSAYIMTHLLKSVTEWGTGKALSATELNVAGKTGSVMEAGGGNRDAWMVAYTPHVAVTVWMGFDQPDASHKLPDSANGSEQPAQIASALLTSIPESRMGMFQRPQGVVAVMLDKKALETLHQPLIASPHTPRDQVVEEVFTTSTQPTQITNLWDVPKRVADLTVFANQNGLPEIHFTALEGHTSYRIERIWQKNTSLAAELRGQAGEDMVFIDQDAPVGEVLEYRVVPRHAEFFLDGRVVEGPPSDTLTFIPERRGLFDQMMDGILGITPTPPPVEINSAPKEDAPTPDQTPAGGETEETLLPLFGR